MLIRKATGDEMLSLWDQNLKIMSPTTLFFYDNIKKGNAEFWTYDMDGDLVGELYVFKNLEDKDFADGETRTYLCAFRIIKDLRGKGYGTQLITHVIKHVREEGFKAVTIGVDKTEEDNIRLYHKIGFSEKIKDCIFDPCDVDQKMKAKPCSVYWLLKKNL